MGQNLKAIRQRYGWSLTDVARRSGLSRSTLYKVENAGVALTYDKILQLSDGLNIDLAELFGRVSDTRRSIGRAFLGFEVDTPNLTYVYLCNELLRKRITPIVARVKARDITDYGQLPRHSGEEFDLVLEGEVDVYTEYYETVRLKKGEFIYLDSAMGHAFVSVSREDALVLTVCSGLDNVAEQPPREVDTVASNMTIKAAKPSGPASRARFSRRKMAPRKRQL